MANEFIVKNGLISQNNIIVSGSIIATGGVTISGSIASASYATNADTLDGLDSTVFTLTSSFVAQTASFTAFTSSINSFSASILLYTSSLNNKTSSFATTGSNTFIGTETISGSLVISGSGTPFTLNTDTLEVTGSLIVSGSNTVIGTNTVTGSMLISGSLTATGTITAQTLVVQTVTSSTVYSSGSNIFGNTLANTQTFTGSVLVTGSLTISTGGNASAPTIFGSTISCSPIGCFATSCATSFIGGTMSGTTIYGSTAVCSPVGKFTSCIDVGGAGTFSGNVTNVSALYVRASGNSDLPFINFSNADGVYNWGRVGGLLQGDGDGSLYFQTKLGGSLGTRLTITSTGASTFSSTITGTTIYGSTAVCSAVGCFATSCATSLNISGNSTLNVIKYTQGTYKVYRNLARYDNYNNGAGAIALYTSIPWSAANMLTIQVKGYQYGNMPFDITFATYAGEGNFYSPGYFTNSGNNIFPQHAWYKDANDKVVLVLGSTSGTYGVQIWASEFKQGFQTLNDTYAEGWSYNKITTTTGLSNGVAIPDKTYTGGAFNGNSINSTYNNGNGCRYNFTALNTAQDLVGICANNGVLVMRDHTAGGTGAFLIDPNQGVICMASNIPATVAIAWNGSTWRWCLTSGSVPRCLGYGFYGA
jgi:hypothetical protein